MTGELYWLALSIALALVIWIPYAGLYGSLVGTKTATTDRPPHDQLPEWAKRCQRAHINLIETLLPFGLLVLILKTTGETDGGIVTAAAIFFFARLAHVIVYVMAVPYLRTAAYAVSWLTCLYLLWRVLS